VGHGRWQPSLRTAVDPAIGAVGNDLIRTVIRHCIPGWVDFPDVNVLLPVGKALSVAGVINDVTVLGGRQVSALEG
jgi:hypothetical protein